MIFPYFILSQYISLFHFIERLETLVMIIWVGGVAVKLAVFIHSSAIAAAGALGLKSYRVTLLPIAVIMVILSRVLYDTFFKLFDFLIYTWPPYATVVELVIPALILLVAVIRKKGGGRLANQ
jgi:spore germination protein KB